MRRLVYKWIINSLALLVTAYLLQNRVHLATPATALVAAAILGIVNVLLKPILLLLTLPINIMTLGLFTLVVNGLMIQLVSALVAGFEIRGGILSAIVVAVILTIVSWVINGLFGD